MGVTVPFVYAQFRRARSGVETTGRGHIHDDDDDEDANAAGRYSNRPRNSAPATTTARRARSVFRKSCFARERLDLDEDESDDESSHAGECIISPGGEDGVRTESSSSSPREAAGRVAEQMGIDKSEVPDGSTAEGAEGADTAVRASRFDPRVRSMPPLVETRHTTQRHRRRTLTRASRLQSNNESSSQTQQLDTHTQILKYPNTNQIPPKHTWRAYVFRTLDDPGSGTLARWVNVTVTSTVLASIVCHVMESRREYADDATLKRIGLVCQILFTVEYGLKLATAPRRVTFVKAPANVVDLLAVAPFWLELIVQVCVEVSTGKQSDENGEGGVSGLLRTFRLFRVLRVFRLGARMRKLEIVADAVRDSVEVFGMLLLLLALALVVFSSLVYFCEQGSWIDADLADSHEDDPFSSIPATFWWCVVTLTTVGYGDAYPLTAYGKLAAAFTMIASVVITALPISVIGANFTQRWLDHKADERDESRKRQTKSRVLGEFVRVLGAHVEVVDAVLAATEAAHVRLRNALAETESNLLLVQDFDFDDTNRRTSAKSSLPLEDAINVAVDDGFRAVREACECLEELRAVASLLTGPSGDGSNLADILEKCAMIDERVAVSLDAADVAIAAADKSAKGHCDVWVSSAALEAKLLSAKDDTERMNNSVKNRNSILETAECVVTVKP